MLPARSPRACRPSSVRSSASSCCWWSSWSWRRRAQQRQRRLCRVRRRRRAHHSLVPLTGWAGQISFAQITFVGFGAWAGFEFSNSGGDAFGLHLYPAGSPLALIVAAIVAIPIGLLMALPAPPPGSVSRARVDGVRADGARDLRLARGVQQHRTQDRSAQHVRLLVRQGVHDPRRRLSRWLGILDLRDVPLRRRWPRRRCAATQHLRPPAGRHA